MSSAESPGQHRPGQLVRQLTTIGAVSAAFALILTALVATGNSAVLSVDEWLNSAMTSLTADQAWLLDVAEAIGIATSPVPSTALVVVTVITLAGLRTWHLAALLATSGILGVIVAQVIKTAMGRTRPPGADPYVTFLDKSFPSGHAMAGIYTYVCIGIILILLGRQHNQTILLALGRALLVFGPLIGVSRIFLGVHWLSDVVAGWFYGTAVLMLALVVMYLLQGRDRPLRSRERPTRTDPEPIADS